MDLPCQAFDVTTDRALQQVATILLNSRPKIQKWISDAESDDPESLGMFIFFCFAKHLSSLSPQIHISKRMTRLTVFFHDTMHSNEARLLPLQFRQNFFQATMTRSLSSISTMPHRIQVQAAAPGRVASQRT